MPTPTPSLNPPRKPDRSRFAQIGMAAGAGLLMVVCCAGPALFAAGVLGAVSAWLRSPWLLGLAAVAALSVLVRLWRHLQKRDSAH